MSSLKIQQFGGQLPAWDDAVLPVSQAAASQNCYLFSGALLGWRKPKLLRTLNDPLAVAAFRVPTLTQVKATSILTFSANPNSGDFVKIGEIIYTFNNLLSLPFTIMIGVTVAQTMTNLLKALQIGIDPVADAAAIAASAFSLNTNQNLDLSQTAGETHIAGSTIVVTAADYGLAYNTLQSTESTGGVRLSWSGTVFSGGTNSLFTTDITSPASWLELRDQYTNVLRSPIVDDKYNRIYTASPSKPPQYNTYARIAAGPTGPNAPFLLGLNPPGCPPVVTPTGGGLTGPGGYPNSTSSNVVTPGSNTLFLFPFTPTGVGISVADVNIMPAATANGSTGPAGIGVPGVTGAARFMGVIYENIVGTTGPTGQPGALLGGGSVVTGCVAGVPITSAFSTPPTLLINTTYWIGFLTDAAVPFQLADDSANLGMVSYPYTMNNGPPALISTGTVPVIALSATFVPPFEYLLTLDTPLAQNVGLYDTLAFGPGTDGFTFQTSRSALAGATQVYMTFPVGSGSPVGLSVRDLTVPTAIMGAPVPPGTATADLQMWMATLTGATMETRAYVYTWVTAYDEESPPSPPTVLTSWSNAVWNIGMFEPPADDMGVLRNIVSKRIYRTISAVGGQTDYFQVTPYVAAGHPIPVANGDFPVALASFDDNVDDLTTSLNIILPSATWFPPPEGLEGIVSMPNGMIAGWMKNEIWFCEPYRPHAWPPGYVITTEFPIVGLGVTGNSLVAATNGTPYLATGINPGSLAQTKVLIAEPCNSRGSIVSTLGAVYYTSPNGLISVTGYGVGMNMTETWITREKWASLAMAKGTVAIPLVGCYLAFGTVQGSDHSLAQQGYTIQLANDTGSFTIWPQPGGHRLGFNKMTAPGAQDIWNVQIDPWTGVGMLIQNGGIYYYDFTDQASTMTPYTWRSKVYQQPSKKSFEAMKLFFSVPPGTPTPGVRNTAATNDASWNTLGPNQYAIVRVYADYGPDDTLLLVTTREVQKSGELLRIASGFKAERWQWEITGQVYVSNLQVATSARELGSV